MKDLTNPFLAAIREGRAQIGLWISLASHWAAAPLAHAGFDWVLIDCEHAPTELTDVLGILQAFEGTATTPIVRPDWNDPVKVKRLLDLGAQGLLFPMVQNVAQAEAAVAATRYPPRGVRGVSTQTRGNDFGRVADYFDRIEDETAVIVQLETRAALALAESIATVDGVAGVFFGPADIGADMGHLGQPMADEVWAAIMPVARMLIAKGVPVGTIVTDLDFATKLFGEGFTFVACGTDAGLLARGADSLMDQMTKRIGRG